MEKKKKKKAAPENKAMSAAPENKKESDKAKVYEVAKDYCGIPKGAIIDHTKFGQTIINDMVKKGYWKCK